MIGLIVIGGLALLLFAGLVGSANKTGALSRFSPTTAQAETVPLPQGLPAPVGRFYRKIYGENIPVIKSAVITGRAEVRPVGPITFPARFRFTHDAGKGYRHYIEATVFGLPLMRVKRTLPRWGVLAGNAVLAWMRAKKIDQGANLGLLVGIHLAAIYFPHRPARALEPVDDNTALLAGPFRREPRALRRAVRSRHRLVTWFESMRYQGSASTSKVL